MARIVLVTGGCRSGKSRYAQQLAESLPAPRLYVATCQPGDEEMRERVRRHRQSRAGRGWETAEEPIRVVELLRRNDPFRVVLVDCLTLWVANLMERCAPVGQSLDEDTLAERCESLMAAARLRRGTVILVTNEVGMGIVPESVLARKFRDLMGRSNQVIGAQADQVVLMACGIPLVLKGSQDGDVGADD
ncbi:MAG TPA: bifunctional adenosylcobinamide kinase/adenosylcobinamide-phosphate guanylyltransferase [Planctomycetaceae bacterium]|nr:bifunctional adenosylcobinamide kinase/adenosylcobinamide-phosphate guanylyltransferase [Planctomycetaceae bacterium]HIQ22474.1 bifunctional adenosylcobinamide kinase/adenosylcobinamide-phosphate guanylyltransferase [Planctomycetota bacterium]